MFNSLTPFQTRVVRSVLALLAVVLASAPALADTRLYNYTAVTQISGFYGSTKYYYIDVPIYVESLVVKTFGGVGNCDLFVQRNAAGSPIYSNRSLTNAATITINSPASGRWRIMLLGRSSPFYAGVNLRANYTLQPRPQNNQVAVLAPREVPLSEWVVPNLWGFVDRGTWAFRVETVEFDIPAGAYAVKIETYGGTGDLELIGRRGLEPSFFIDFANGLWVTNAERRAGSNVGTTAETLWIPHPTAGVYTLALLPIDDYSGVTVKITIW